MMGRTHALTGAAAFTAAAIPTGRVVPLHPAEIVLGAVVTAGAAVLPDLDHPGAGVSRTFGPFTRAAARLVGWVSGGHRNGTHSLAGVAVAALTVFAATGLATGDPALPVLGVGLCIVLTAAGLLVAATGPPASSRPRAAARPRPRRLAAAAAAAAAAATVMVLLLGPRGTGLAVLGALLVLVLAAVARLVRTRRLLGLRREWDDALPIPVTLAMLAGGADLRVVPFAVVLGVLVHIVGDMVTVEGCPLGWPWSRAMRGPGWFSTGAPVELGPITWVCTGLSIAAAGWHTGILPAVIGA